MDLTDSLGVPTFRASFKVSQSHLGFFFLKVSSHTGLSSSEELPELETPVTCEPVVRVQATGELCDPEALYGVLVIVDPSPVPEDPDG